MEIKYLVRSLEDEHFNYKKDKDDQIMLFGSFAEAWNETDNALKGFVERIDLSEKFVICDNNKVSYDDEDMAIEHYDIVNLYQILNEINRDRSEEWTDYDQSDYKEGLKEWTDWTLIGELQPC